MNFLSNLIGPLVGVAVGFFAALLFTSDGDDECYQPEAEKPAEKESVEVALPPTEIKMAIHNWSSQIAGSNVLADLLRKKGYEVQLEAHDSHDVYDQLAAGNVDIVYEVWDRTFSESIERNVENIVEVAIHGEGREGLAIAGFTQDKYPYLDLTKTSVLSEYPEIFNQKILGPPKDWGKNSEDIMNVSDMSPFEYIDGHVPDEINQMLAQGEDLISYQWTPNSTTYQYSFEFIDVEDPIVSNLKTFISKNFSNNGPSDAIDLVSKFQLSNEEMSELAYNVDMGGMTYEESADAFLGDHPEFFDLAV